MIKNERQYRITKAQAEKFEQALGQLAASEPAKQENLLLWQLQKEAIESQLHELREELEEYEALTNSSSSQSIGLVLHSLSELPAALIKARIAAKLSQKALGERLGLKEQQIQRYEATEYASANLARVIEVSETLGLKLEIKGDLETVRPEREQYKRKAQIPYITGIERVAKQEGMLEGRREGLRQGLLSSIELILELKFGSEGSQFFPEIVQIEDVETLKAILSGLRQVNTLAELRSIYQA